MKHLTIIVPDGQSTLTSVSCILGAYDIFTSANQYWKEQGREELFKIQLAGVSKKAKFNNGLLTLRPQVNISTITQTHLIIVPSVIHQKAMKRNKLLADWIAKQYKKGAEISSMCTGAFYAGLIRFARWKKLFYALGCR